MIEDEILEEAAATDPVTVETFSSEQEGVTVNVSLYNTEAASSVLEDDQTSDGEAASSDTTYTFTSIDVSEDPQSDDALVMSDVIRSVLGEYQRQTYTITEVDSSGNVVGTSTEYVPGLAGLDYHWIAGTILFGLLIAGIFKLLGGLIRS